MIFFRRLLPVITLLLSLFCFLSVAARNANAQIDAMEQFAGKLLDASKKCQPSKFKPYLNHVKANLNAGRFEAALELMKFDAVDDPMPRLVAAMEVYAWSMARAGRADEVAGQLSSLQNNKPVRIWQSRNIDKQFADIYSDKVLQGTAIYLADKGELEKALEKDPGKHGFKRIIVHLLNTGKDNSASQAIKTFFGNDTERTQDFLRDLRELPGEFALTLLKRNPALTFNIVERLNESDQSNKLKWETFQKIAATASPETLETIEIEALNGDYLPTEYQERIVERSLKQIPSVDPESNLDLNIFDYLVRHNKLETAKRLFDSVDLERSGCFSRAEELAERLFNAGKQQAAIGVLDRIVECEIKDEYGSASFRDNELALKIGHSDAADQLNKLSQIENRRHHQLYGRNKEEKELDKKWEQDRESILKLHRKVQQSGFSSVKSVVDPLKDCWDELVESAEQDFLNPTEKSLRDSLLWEHLLAELAIRNDSKLAYEATLALPKRIVGDQDIKGLPIRIGPVMKTLLTRGYDQKAIEYAQCWRDSPNGSISLRDFFPNTWSSDNDYEFKPETEMEILLAIGAKLSSDRDYLYHLNEQALAKLKKAFADKDKEEALRLAQTLLRKKGSLDEAGFTRLNWHESLIELAKKIGDRETAQEVIGGVSEALFQSRRIDELILHLEKHEPLFYRDQPVRFNSLINYASRTNSYLTVTN